MTDNHLLRLLKRLVFTKLGNQVWEVQRKVRRSDGDDDQIVCMIIVKTDKGIAHRAIAAHGETVETDLELSLEAIGIPLISFYEALWGTTLERLGGMQVLMLARTIDGESQRSPVERKRWRVM
tara:strand:+ start:2568 stop:2936 length:369 start_codon:yes stop_codon:yes gene_type:complete